jgi:hypothetical protein
MSKPFRKLCNTAKVSTVQDANLEMLPLSHILAQGLASHFRKGTISA